MSCVDAHKGQLPQLRHEDGEKDIRSVIGSKIVLGHFLLRMHQDDGSYIMHEDGEKDIRSVIGSKIVLGLTLLRGCRGSKDRYQVMC